MGRRNTISPLAQSRPTLPATVNRHFVMIDKRKIIKQHDEIDLVLQNLTDSEILLEFSNALALLYPTLKKLRSHCYDNFDDISENLFFDLVYYTFAGKYGAIISKTETHKYGFTLHTYKHINHISIKPKSFPISFIDSNGQTIMYEESDFAAKEFVFIQFGDTFNYLGSEEDDIDFDRINFDYVNFAIVDKVKGLYFRNSDHYWVDKLMVDFDLILEDFSQKEHKTYKENKYAN